MQENQNALTMMKLSFKQGVFLVLVRTRQKVCCFWCSWEKLQTFFRQTSQYQYVWGSEVIIMLQLQVSFPNVILTFFFFTCCIFNGTESFFCSLISMTAFIFFNSFLMFAWPSFAKLFSFLFFFEYTPVIEDVRAADG